MLDTLRISTLPNGIRVLSVAKPQAEGVRLAIHVRVGSRNEPEPLNGASHFIEHMLFKGTARRSAKALSQAIEGQGGSINAYTDRDNTCYYAEVPADKAHRALDVLGDLFYNATFDPKELDRERHVIAEEIHMYADQPDSVAIENLAAQLWSGHPLGRPILGPMDGILAMPRADLLAYRAANYTPGRTLFAFEGRVRHDACVKAVEALAGALPAAPAAREPEPFTRAIPQDPFSLTRRDINQTQLAFGWRTAGLEVAPKARATLRFLSAVLGESMMSRLFQSIRERRGLCYSVASGTSTFADAGAFYVAAGCHPDKAYGGAKAILAEIRKLIEKPIGAAELRRTRDYLCGRFRLRLDRSAAGWAAAQTLFGQAPDAEATLAAFRAVTPEDLREAAATYLAPDRLALAVVAPNRARHGAEAWTRLMHY